MRSLIRLLPLLVLSLACTASGQTATTTAPATATQPAISPWFRVTTTTNQVGATAALTVQTYNAEDGTTVTQLDSGDNLRLSYQDPKTLDYLDYTVISKELRRAELAPWLKDGLLNQAKYTLTTLTWDASVARWKNLLGANWKDITPTDDGALKKYDLAGGNSILAPAARRNSPIASVPDVAWVDPASNRLTRTTTKFVAGPREWEVTVAYEYQIEGPADIYAAGVPRDARIVDNRPSKETRDVLDRIQDRINKGFGDYVGVVTDSLIRPDGGADPIRTTVRLVARKGSVGLSETFTAQPRELPNHPGIVLPEKWLDIPGDELVRLARKSLPNSFVAFDNDKVTGGRFLRGRMDYTYGNTIDRGTAQGLASVGLFVWPNIAVIPRYTPEVQARLITDDADHQGLIGVEVTFLGPANDYYKSQTVHWIDPSNNDVLVESTDTVFRGGSNLNRQTSQETRVTEFGKLPDGRVYPARWTVTSRRQTGDGFLDPYMKRDCRLVLVPDKEFDATWIPSTQPATAPAIKP